MCVDPRWYVRAAAVLVSAVFVAAASGCGGTQPRQDGPGAMQPADKVLTAAERAAWYQACWAHFNEKAWDRFKACYADDAESDQVDSGQPRSKGPNAIEASAQSLAAAFPDIRGTGELILIKGESIVGVYVLNGTHTGSLLGADGHAIPPTSKPIGLRQAHVVQADSTGSRVVREELYSDSGTMMAQIGLNPAPARPVTTSAATAPIVVIAAGTPAELSNVEAARAQVAAYNSRDAKGVDAYNAPDLVHRNMAAPADQTAEETLAGMLAIFQAFPDAKLVPTSVWGAGSYVVVTGRFEGTNSGPLPAMGLKTASNRPVSVRYLSITRWENGKVEEEWLFYDGMAFAKQLGLLKK
ncbi:MAG: ester cyclase [Vicinamibacterales bacterium]